MGKVDERRAEEAGFLHFLEERGSELRRSFGNSRAKAVTTAAAREKLFLSELDNVFRKLDKKYVPGKSWAPAKIPTPELAVSLNLSDLHYGADLDPREVPVRYGHAEAARRTAAVALWIANHRTLAERRHSDLVVNLLGDIIQNQLHDPRDGTPLAEQFAEAVHLLAQFLVFVSASGYRHVYVNCTPGNHGRNTSRHRERATNQKWDAIETMIYYALSKACQHLPNVTFNIPYQPFVTYSVFGHKVFATHGDTVLKPGYPGETINVAGIRKQVNEINAKFDAADRYSVFVCGHVHVSSKTKLPNGVYFLSNGCLIPTDAYAQSIGIMDTSTCQTMFESTPKFPVGFHCEIDVGQSHDIDKSLDKIIQPFKGIDR